MYPKLVLELTDWLQMWSSIPPPQVLELQAAALLWEDVSTRRPR